MSFHAASELVRSPTGLILWASRMGGRDRLWSGAGDSEVQRFSFCPMLSHKALASDRTRWGPTPRDSSRDAKGRLEDGTGSAETQIFSLLCMLFRGVLDLDGTRAGLVP